MAQSGNRKRKEQVEEMTSFTTITNGALFRRDTSRSLRSRVSTIKMVVLTADVSLDKKRKKQKVERCKGKKIRASPVRRGEPQTRYGLENTACSR